MEGALLESASRCLGVRGVIVCIGFRSSSSTIAALDISHLIDLESIDLVGVSCGCFSGVDISIFCTRVLNEVGGLFSLFSIKVESLFERVTLVNPNRIISCCYHPD